MKDDIFGIEIYEEWALGAEVFYADISKIDIDNAKKCVSEYRLKKVEALKKSDDKRRSLGAELLLMYALKKHGIIHPIEFETDNYGKPYLKNCDKIKFNLSHSGDVAVCAVSTKAVGVDIEKSNRISEQIADRYFSAEEKKQPFAYIWTRKEALAKASGIGITIGFDKFAVIDDEVELQGESYLLKSITPQISGYCLALCVK